MGSTAGTDRGQYEYGDEDSERPLDSLKDSAKDSADSAKESADSAKHQAGNKFDELKDDIKATTGDIEEDLGQLNVEVLVPPNTVYCARCQPLHQSCSGDGMQLTLLS